MQAEIGDSPVGRVLAKAGKRQRAGKGWLVCCPAHGDSTPSLSVTEGRDGRVLLNCHAGCTPDAIVASWGLEMSDLFGGHAPRDTAERASPSGLTLAEFAEAKRLSTERLQAFGVRDSVHFEKQCVEFAYVRLDGSVGRPRLRLAMGKEGFRWKGRDGELAAYAPDRCALAREERYAVLVEGESDTLTLLTAGIPAIGCPGANTARVLTASHLEGLSCLFIVQEPDAGGASFAAAVQERTRELAYSGAVHVLRMPAGVKDPSSLYLRAPNDFAQTFHGLMNAAAEPVRPKYLPLSEMVASALRPVGARLETGLPSLDQATRGGIPLGRVVVLAGAPGAGKSTLGVQLAERFEQQGCAVVYLAADEPADGIVTRLGQLAGFSRDALESEGDAGDAVRAGFARRSEGRVLAVVDPDADDAMHTIEDADAALAHLAGTRPRVLIVDSLQTAACQAATAVAGESARERMDAKLAVIKTIARRGALVLAITEMARSGYRSGDRAQDTSALASSKESGSIEYAAALLLGLRSVKGEQGQVDVEVAKNRLGGTKPELRLKLDFERASFAEVELPSEGERFETRRAANLSRVESDARTLLKLLLNQPGMGERELRSAVRGAGHTWGRDRLDAAKAKLSVGIDGHRLSNRGNGRGSSWLVELAEQGEIT